jgi:hypothetical protein
VCERRVDLLVCSLPLHRHSYIGFILAFASSFHNKQIDAIVDISLLEVDTLMYRSICRLSILVSMQFFPNYRITMTAHIDGNWKTDWTRWTPEVSKKLSVSRWSCKSKSRTNSQWRGRFVHESSNGEPLNVYYESINRELKIKPIYECRCDERLKTKAEESTHLGYTGLLGELEYLKIPTRSIDEKMWVWSSGVSMWSDSRPVNVKVNP